MVGSTAFFVAMMLAEAAAPGTQEVKPAKDPERIICRRQVETGSLVKAKKTCHTAREWAQLADLGRRDAEDIAVAKNGVNSN